MAHELSTIGVQLWYCIGDANVRPTAGYTQLVGLKSAPSTGDAPNTLQVTDLDDEYHRYVLGVQDVGGARAYTFNDSVDTRSAWNAMYEAYQTASAQGKVVWFEEKFPQGQGAMDSFYFAGMPSKWTVNERSVDSVIEATGYVTPNQVIGFASPSTAGVDYTVTNTLTKCSTSNPVARASGSYFAVLTADDGYTLSSVEVTMGASDITSTAYNSANGSIYIASVTGNIVIEATAST